MKGVAKKVKRAPIESGHQQRTRAILDCIAQPGAPAKPRRAGGYSVIKMRYDQAHPGARQSSSAPVIMNQ